MLIEENGYQIRYWDEITNNIGECIAQAWNHKHLYEKLKSQGFNIKKRELKEAIEMIDQTPFVILSSHKKDSKDLDNFINSSFMIDK